MAQSQHLSEHTFRFRNRTIRLLYSIERKEDERRLILEDVLATSQKVADAVPDWRIESEALKVAFDHYARYM